mmetsp:Transcript_10160/g.35593  ORF Transcript_10160/g.35593 Transcript_10160/m.35593 type:complete len:206 (+) Transcript_10160:1612-2229(+)
MAGLRAAAGGDAAAVGGHADDAVLRPAAGEPGVRQPRLCGALQPARGRRDHGAGVRDAVAQEPRQGGGHQGGSGVAQGDDAGAAREDPERGAERGDGDAAAAAQDGDGARVGEAGDRGQLDGAARRRAPRADGGANAGAEHGAGRRGCAAGRCQPQPAPGHYGCRSWHRWWGCGGSSRRKHGDGAGCVEMRWLPFGWFGWVDLEL